MKKLLFLALFLLTACQSALDKDGYAYDPWESFNRKTYAFNNALDETILRPASVFYETVTPDFLQNRVSNFFSNIDDIGNLGNSFLQGKWEQGLHITGRFIQNTVFGIGGLFDVASAFGEEKINADFGQTLQIYGVESGPYLVLPFVGPTTPRDFFGSTVDSFSSPITYLPKKSAWSLRLVNVVDKRSALLDSDALIKDSPDAYATMRDAWLQHRWGQLGIKLELPEFDE